MTEKYPNYDRLMENLTAINGDLNVREKAIAFLAYSLGGSDMSLFSDAYEFEAKKCVVEALETVATMVFPESELGFAVSIMQAKAQSTLREIQRWQDEIEEAKSL